MKQFLLDMLFVVVIICIINIFFGHYQVSQTLFERSIDQFEETIVQNEPIQQSYTVVSDTSDNHVSQFFQGISQGCVQVIEYCVLVFSNFVSMFMN